MDELVEKVREALAAEYPGAPNGRVRDLPDRRAIRWYTTIGLVDKPLGMRGRTALYGPRHLQQLVAIKRRQAEGQSLAQIQMEFTWLSPARLGEVSQVPESLLADQGDLTPDMSDRHKRFWADAPPEEAGDAGSRTSFHGDGAASRDARRAAGTVRQVTAVALEGGVIVLVPQTLTDRDRDDIAEAAAPLLALLAARGLTDGSST
nr:MerR family transcriptional regulator [uncultured Actinoplanes sp.]